MQISPDGRQVTFLRAKAEDRTVQDLWVAPAAGGEPHRLVDAYAVAPSGAALSEAEKSRRERERISAQGIVEYRWDEQGRAILVPAGGDLYLADAASGRVERLTQTPGDETDARFSPRGRYVSYVRDKTLYVMDLADRREQAVTPVGRDALSYATAEFVAQEEMERFTGYWWAPDESRLAWTRVDESGVDLIPRLEIGAQGSTLAPERYPRAGRPNAKVELYVSGPLGQAPVKVDLGPDSDIYLARVDWSADGRTLYVQRETRDQSRLDLLSIDPATGASRVIETEAGRPWIDLNDNFKPLKDGDFLWTSQRSGFSHIYLFSRDGRVVRQVTHGDWPAAVRTAAAGASGPGLEGVDEGRGLVYFVASKDTPLGAPALRRFLPHAGRAGGADPRPRLVGGDAGQGRFGLRGHVLRSGHAAPDGALRHRRRASALGRGEQTGARPPLLPLSRPARDAAVRHTNRGRRRHPALLRPAETEGFRPVQAAIPRSWRYTAARIRSTCAPTGAARPNSSTCRTASCCSSSPIAAAPTAGQASAAALAGHLGGVEVQDQLQGVRFLRALPYVDGARIGVTGWSYGGYMSLRLLTEPGAGFKAGAVGAPPTDWRLYDTHYTERFMGLPQLRPAAYDQSADLPRLDHLGGRLLLMQGMADDNVLFANSVAVMDRLQALGTPFDLMLYPGQRHGIRTPGRETQLWRTYLAFFQRELGGPETAPAH